ncbi:MAG: hypothetical protein NVSMB48_00480 [Marmoricola sp.]
MIVVAADKGSPGATVTALALASAWLQPATLVEADPWGADMPLRVRRHGAVLTDRETVLSLATAATAQSTDGRLPEGPDLVDRYAQDLSDQVRVVPGPVSAERAAAVPNWKALATALAASSRPVIADLGRLHVASPSMPVAAAAEVVVVVCRGEISSVLRLRERVTALVPALAELRGSAPRVIPVVVSSKRHGPGDAIDVQAALAETAAGPFITTVGWLAWDPSSVEALYRGEAPGGRSLARTALMKSATDLANRIVAAAGTVVEPTPANEGGVPRWADALNGSRS